jgi:hypothetical protein
MLIRVGYIAVDPCCISLSLLRKEDGMLGCRLVLLCAFVWLCCLGPVQAAPPTVMSLRTDVFDRLTRVCHATQYDARCSAAIERFSTSIEPGRVVSVRLAASCESAESGTMTLDAYGRFTALTICRKPFAE